MPIPLKLSIDAGTLITVPTSAFVICQGTTSAGKPIRLKRLRLGSSNTGSTQQVVQLQLVYYATGTGTGGTQPTATPVDEALTGVYTAATAFRCGTSTMGTTATVKWQDQWLTCNPYDLVHGQIELQDEIPVSKAWAFIIPVACSTSFNLNGTLNFEEFG
jgi:hypothetical protein